MSTQASGPGRAQAATQPANPDKPDDSTERPTNPADPVDHGEKKHDEADKVAKQAEDLAAREVPPPGALSTASSRGYAEDEEAESALVKPPAGN